MLGTIKYIVSQENVEICCEILFVCFVLLEDTLQTISVSIVLLQMENEQCGITRVLLRLPLVIVIGKYVAYQTIGGLPSGYKRYDLCRVWIPLVLSSIFHVVE